MTSTKEVLLHCYRLLETGAEGVNDVTSTLLELYSNPETIKELFELNQQSDSTFVQKISVIGIKNIIRALFNENKEIPDDLINYLKMMTIQGLQSEVSEESKKWYIYISTMLLSKLIPSPGFPELIDVAAAFIQDPLQIQTGLLLWSNINKEMSAEHMSQFIPGLLQAITASLQIEDRPNVRILGLGLFLSLLERQCNIDIFKENGEFHAALQAEFHRAILGGASDDERSQVTETISYMIRSDSGFEVLEPSFKQIYHITYESFFNEELTWKIRLDCLGILNTVLNQNPKMCEPFIEELIPATINLTVAQCMQEGRENFEPHFTDVLYTILASDEDIAPILISEILAAAQTNLEEDSPDIILIQVLVQMFGYLSEGANVGLNDFAQDIINDVFIKCLGSEDDVLISATCLSMAQISETSPGFFTDFIDSITEILIQLHENEESLKSLQKILQNSEIGVSDASQVLSALVQLIQEGFQNGNDLSDLIGCITQVISHFSGDGSAFYVDIRDVLVALIKESDFKGVCFECFSYLCKMAPQLANLDLPAFLESMAGFITPENIESTRSIAESLRNIAIVMPTTLEPFIPQLFESLYPFLVNDISGNTLLTDDEKAMENEENSTVVQGCILACLSSMISVCPVQLQNFVESVVNFICNWLTDESEQKVSFAADSVRDIIQGLVVLRYNPENIISSIYATMGTSSDIDLVNSLLSSLAFVIANCGANVSDEVVGRLHDFILEIISGQNENYLDEKNFIEREISSSFFYFVKCFILGGLAQRSDCSQFIQPLIEISSTQHDSTKILSLLCLSRLIFVFHDTLGELCGEVIGRLRQTMENARTITNEMKGNIFAIIAIICSIVGGNLSVFGESLEFFAQQISENITSSSNMVSSNAALAVICLTANGVNLDSSILEAAFKKMPPPCDEEDVAFYALAAPKLVGIDSDVMVKAAVAVFGSSQFIINLIGHDLLNELLNVARNVNIESVSQILAGNEFNIDKFRKNITQ